MADGFGAPRYGLRPTAGPHRCLAARNGHNSISRQRASANSKHCQREALPVWFTANYAIRTTAPRRDGLRPRGCLIVLLRSRLNTASEAFRELREAHLLYAFLWRPPLLSFICRDLKQKGELIN